MNAGAENQKTIPDRKKIRWAILGTGEIARVFAADIRHAANAEPVAVASRSADKARAFADEFGIEHAHASLDALAADPNIDAVYVATPNTKHAQAALSLIEAGKAVLVEKPLAVSAAEAETVTRAAAGANIFLMEAMWTRFLPAALYVRQAIADGRIGTIRKIAASLAFRKDYDPNSRFFAPWDGGGAMLDLGVYPVSLAIYLLGVPEKVDGQWTAAPSGVDMSASIRLGFANAEAEISCGFDRDGDNRFLVEGSDGSLVIEAPFLKAMKVTVHPEGGRPPLPGHSAQPRLLRLADRIARRLPLSGIETIKLPFEGNGLQFEIAAASDAILNGMTMHPLAPHAHSVETLRILDAVRAKKPEG